MNKALEALDMDDHLDQLEKDCELMIHSLRKGYKQGQVTFAKRMLTDIQTIRTHLNTWRPISEAPRDGTEILAIFSSDFGYQEKPTIYGPWTVSWNGKKWRSSWDGCEVINYMSDFGTDYKEPQSDPTHWMPLPEPPPEIKGDA